MRREEWKEIHDYCMKKPCAYESRPFGEEPICYRISGKIFCQLTAKEDWYKMTVKTNPDAADFYRRAYPGIVVRGYHCPPVQQPYWNTVELSQVTKELAFQMIDEAYQEVVCHLTKKEQNRIPQKAEFHFVKTDGEDKDFVKLCAELDEALDESVGGNKQRSQYNQYNQRDSIHDVIVIYKDDKAIGAGAYKLYDEETVEIKRVFVEKEYRKAGLGKELLLRLEADARIKGFRSAVLETGKPLQAAMNLYKKSGYKIIPNYGQYADMPESICMAKRI